MGLLRRYGAKPLDYAGTYRRRGAALPEEVIHRLEDPKVRNKLLRDIGRVILDEARKNFRRQSMGAFRGLVPGGKWKPRYPQQVDKEKVNVAGAIDDLQDSAVIKPRRFKGRPALIDTGSLLDSLNDTDAISIPKKYVVRVGTNLPYARLMQFGGKGNVKLLGEDFKSNLYEALQERKDVDGKYTDEGRALQSNMAWLFSQENYQADVNPRPFLGLTFNVRRRIRGLIKKALGVSLSYSWRQ
jgi:phage gpG-like protein